MAMNNENNIKSLIIPLGSPSADAVIPGPYFSKKARLVGVRLNNNANIAASDTDFVQLELRDGSTVLAEIDTRAAHENGLVQRVSKALNLVSAALSEIAAGKDLNVNYNETDSGTAVALTDARLQIDYVEY